MERPKKRVQTTENGSLVISPVKFHPGGAAGNWYWPARPTIGAPVLEALGLVIDFRNRTVYMVLP